MDLREAAAAPAGAFNVPCQPLPPGEVEQLCGSVHMPVCGKDGRTYSSKCHLDSACVDYGHAGQCGQAARPGSLPNFDFTPKLGFVYLCLAVLAFVVLILDHLAVPR